MWTLQDRRHRHIALLSKEPNFAAFYDHILENAVPSLRRISTMTDERGSEVLDAEVSAAAAAEEK